MHNVPVHQDIMEIQQSNVHRKLLALVPVILVVKMLDVEK